MTENQARASLCDVADEKYDKVDIEGVQIQPPEIMTALLLKAGADQSFNRRSVVPCQFKFRAVT